MKRLILHALPLADTRYFILNPNIIVSTPLLDNPSLRSSSLNIRETLTFNTKGEIVPFILMCVLLEKREEKIP
jgi:hypothetical protein